MIRKLLRALMVAALALVAVPAGATVPASAEAPNEPYLALRYSNQGEIHCQLPYLSTGLGPIAQCSRLHSRGRAVFGFYSPITKDFNTTFGSNAVSTYEPFDGFCTGRDLAPGHCLGYPLIATGQLTRATQYQPYHQGRWGWANPRTREFSADGGWYPVIWP